MDIEYCTTHNEPIVLFDMNISNLKQEGLCQICIQSNVKLKKDDKLQNKLIIQILKQLKEELNQYKTDLNKALDKMLIHILQQIERMEEVQIISYQLNNQLSSNIIIYENQNINYEENLKMQNLINEQQKNLEQAIKVEKIQNYLSKLEKIMQIQEMDLNQHKPFEYKLQENAGKKDIGTCCAICFNQDASLIFYGCNELIKINKFEKGYILNQIQELNGHDCMISCLNYMRYSNELVSAGYDNFMLIWNRNEYGQWMIKQTLTYHQNAIDCLVINNKEQLLISGSSDKTIKFWEKKNEIWIGQQAIKLNQCVSSLSLDDESDTLIACCPSLNELLIIRSEKDQWIIKQIINVQKSGFRLCFIGSNIFTFQSNCCEQLEIYEFDKQLNQFTKTKEIQVESSEGMNQLFPCQYIKSREILFIKNNAYLNIIRRQENGEFIQQQSIDFKTEQLFGRATDDGIYLATYDCESSDIQIRKLEYK